MPRARNIKPGFFENEHLGALPGDIQLLFIGLWTQADREGVLEYRPGKLRKALFGFRPDVTLEVFNRYITVLEQVDNGSSLVKVSYEEKEYLIVINFNDHQKPHHTEKKGKLPPRKLLLSRAESHLTVKPPLDNANTPYQNALIPDSLIPDSLIQDKKKIIKKEKIVLPLPEWLNVQDWNDYLEMRKEKKKPATLRAQQLSILTLEELKKKGHDPSEVLKQSIMNGWTGLFQIKQEQNNANKTGFNNNFRGSNSARDEKPSTNRDRLMSAIFNASPPNKQL